MSRIAYLILLLFAASCARNSSQTWEDVKTAGRYMQRGIDTVFGKDYESRMLTSDEEFLGPFDEDFVPLNESDLKNHFAASDTPMPQPKGIPGRNGVPSLDEFYPAPDSLHALFQPVHFETDEHVIKDKAEVAGLIQLAAYLKKNPNIYLAIEGHCDERASASYNVALGMRRANFVRSFLIKNGVDLNRLYTVSRGKEQPKSLGHNADAWKVNRRSEFKMYQR